MSRFSVERVAGHNGYNVIDADGVPKTGIVANFDVADRMREALERKAARRRRPCLRCRKPFVSEGAHNRMCDMCRKTINGIAVQSHAGPL